jgi:hypothetical protein
VAEQVLNTEEVVRAALELLDDVGLNGGTEVASKSAAA